MMKYLIILLDDTSVSFCHYSISKKERNIIPLELLKKAVFYAMKENLNIQFVYPEYDIPTEYEQVIESIDHIKIKPSTAANDADIIVFKDIESASGFKFNRESTYAVRCQKEELFAKYDEIISILRQSKRLNVVITNVEEFNEKDFNTYNELLEKFSKAIEELYTRGITPQLNLLTDRLMLDSMNNCDAGISSITLAPNGKFYICPAFYYSGCCDGTELTQDDVCQKGYSSGNIDEGIKIKNQRLYELSHAPLCRKCDAYQCRRCVWLNRKTTLEVNTPSHEQCVVAHIERNASSKLLYRMRKHGNFFPNIKELKETEYLDTFEIRDIW